MEEIDKNLEEDILIEFKENRRGYLNKLRNKNYQHIKQYLWNRFPMLQDKKYSFGMRLYWLENGINDFPRCAWTKDGEHQNKTERCHANGYETSYCGEQCAHKAGAEKGQQTKASRYGDPHWHNQEKAKKTNIQRYGCENPFANPDIAKRIQEKNNKNARIRIKKAWETRRKNDPIGSVRKHYEIGIPRTYKYNSQFPNEIDQLFLEWLDWSGIKDFEVRKYTKKQRATIKRKFKQYKILLTNNFKPNFSLEEWLKCQDPQKIEMNWICPKGHYFRDRYKPHYSLEHLRCPICQPYLDIGTSDIEKEMISFIEQELDGDCIKNTRDIIKPLELDAYVIDKKVAFEMDGLYQHSDVNKSKHYHQFKTNICKKNGIQLVHIFEDEWKSKQDICKSYIKQALDLNEKLCATSLQVRKITKDEANSFFLANCILDVNMQDGDISYGLFQKNKMLFTCSFAKLKANKHEIIGFCNLLGYDVIGAIDAICKQFIEDFQPSYIRCKVDRRFYSELNFHDCKMFATQFLERIDFYYISYGCKRKICKWQVNQNFLQQLKMYDETKTIKDNLKDNKFTKIYDSGKIVFTWKK